MKRGEDLLKTIGKKNSEIISQNLSGMTRVRCIFKPSKAKEFLKFFSRRYKKMSMCLRRESLAGIVPTSVIRRKTTLEPGTDSPRVKGTSNSALRKKPQRHLLTIARRRIQCTHLIRYVFLIYGVSSSVQQRTPRRSHKGDAKHLNSVLTRVFHIAMQLSDETDAFQRRQKSWSEKNSTKPNPRKKRLWLLYFS